MSAAECKTDGCTREPFDDGGYCGTCLNYIDGTYPIMTDGGQDAGFESGGLQQAEENLARTAEILQNANPFADAELVIYTADTEFAEEEPTHANLEKLELASFSLWARFEEDKIEIPILGEASWHIWYSLSAESFHPDPADPVSDAFVESIVQMVDGDLGDGWGDVEEDVWQEQRDVEKYITILTRDAFLRQRNAEPALVIDWCQQAAEERGLA